MVVTTFDLILAARFKKIKTCRFSFLFFSFLAYPFLYMCLVFTNLRCPESFQKHLALLTSIMNKKIQNKEQKNK